MAKYKSGQKVVFKCVSTFNLPQSILPAEDEIVTIDSYYGMIGHIHCYRVKHYMKNRYGNDQAINEKALHPLKFNSSSAEIILKFSMTEEKSDIKIKEPELV